MKKLLAFLRLSRPHFLLGGFVLYALGAAIAFHEGVAIDWGLYLAGQLAVTSVQLMTHYLNEYWDYEADKLNHNRTFFSGGSGVLPDGLLSRQTALNAAISCAVFAFLAFGLLIARFHTGALVAVIFTLAFAGSFFYSTPPVNLAASGYGEFTTALIVAGLTPMLGYVLQTGRPGTLVVLTTLPLVLLSLSQLLAFEFADYLTDEAAGKRTFLVRVGRRTGQYLHNTLLVAAFSFLALAVLLGLPARVALGALIALPLAVVQIWQVVRLGRGIEISWGRLTFGAVTLFALTAYLLAFGFYMA